MKFSLILATVDRTTEVQRFLENLNRQTYRNFELIVVDQNPDDRLVPILEPYQTRFAVIHLQRVQKGLSKARNVGLKYASGDIIAFPDDDCWYPQKLLEEVVRFFKENQEIGVAVFSTCPKNIIGLLMDWLYKGKPRRLSYLSLPRSVDIFAKVDVVRKIGFFDENLGLGSNGPWIACEEMDYMIRVLKSGFKVVRIHGIGAFIDEVGEGMNYGKVYGYGLSAGYVWRKNDLPFVLGIVRMGATSVAMVESLLRGRLKEARRKWTWMLGFIKGWMGKDG